MKRKGFTLIELLAVIVILAIIALIAVPIITNIIEKAKKGAAESSALGYLSAVENQVAINAVDTSKEDIVDGYYEVSALNSNGVLIKGNGPTSGTVLIDKGQVTACSLTIDKYTVTCLGNGQVRVGIENYIEAKEVYYNPVSGEKCSASEAVSTTGTKDGCMKWYAYKDDGTNYTMILDHNTTALVAWNSSGNNADGMSEVKTALENDTKDWKQTARLITADEVAEITGAKEALDWTSDKKYEDTAVKGKNVSWFYLDGSQGNNTNWKTQISTTQGSSKYAWAFDNINGCISYGCNTSDDNIYENIKTGNKGYMYGYWTSTPIVGYYNLAWRVSNHGDLYKNIINEDSDFGVRPVITISKDLIS